MPEIVFGVTVAAIHGTSSQVAVAALSTALQARGGCASSCRDCVLGYRRSCSRPETMSQVTVASLSTALQAGGMCVFVPRLCFALLSQLPLT